MKHSQTLHRLNTGTQKLLLLLSTPRAEASRSELALIRDGSDCGPSPPPWFPRSHLTDDGCSLLSRDGGWPAPTRRPLRAPLGSVSEQPVSPAPLGALGFPFPGSLLSREGAGCSLSRSPSVSFPRRRAAVQPGPARPLGTLGVKRSVSSNLDTEACLPHRTALWLLTALFLR